MRKKTITAILIMAVMLLTACTKNIDDPDISSSSADTAPGSVDTAPGSAVQDTDLEGQDTGLEGQDTGPEEQDAATETDNEAEQPASPAKPRQITPLSEVMQKDDMTFSCAYEGVPHEFILDLPDETRGAPVVVMLHGYGGSAQTFRSTVAFEKDAVPMGYGVVYVTGAVNPDDPTSSTGWNPEADRGGNDDVGFLTALAVYLQEEYGFDPERTYAAGFSNGGFMLHRLAMEAGDTYSGFASVEGMMLASVWENRNDTNDISFYQITGEKDDLVPKNSDGSAGHSPNPAIEEVMDYWAKSCGLLQSETVTVGKDSELIKYSDENSNRQVWSLFIKGGRHSWPDEKLSGFNMNKEILGFFESIKQ